MESLSGISLADIRVHYNAAIPSGLPALAYTQGTNIHLGPGQERYLAHETWHVVQQKRGRVRATTRLSGRALNDDPELEGEADRMAARVSPRTVIAESDAPATPAAVTGAASGSAGQPVQMQINYNAANIPERIRKQLGTHTGQFNNYRDRTRNTKQALHAQFGMVDRIERLVNQHLDQHSATVTDQERGELFGLLRQTQAEHVGLVQRNVAHGHDLWIRNEGSLSRQERGRRQGQWRSLVGGAGNIQIDNTDPAFRTRTLANFARLLQGQHGAGMVRELNAPQASADRNIIISGDQTANYAMHGKQADAGSWASAIGYVRHNQLLHERLPGGGANTGTGSYVQIQSGAPPATFGDYESDTAGKALFSPEFITLGHELGHARHHLRGTAGSVLAGPTLQDEHWSNPEEHANITGEENPIRAEHGLPQREYHATINRQTAQINRHNLDAQLQQHYNTVPNHLRGRIGPAHFGPMNTAIQQTDLSDPVAHQNLQARMNTLQQNLPGIIWRENLKARIAGALPTWKQALAGATGLAALGTAAYLRYSGEK